MIGFKDYLDDCMQNPVFKKSWEHIRTDMPQSSPRTDRPAMQIFFYEKNGVCPAKNLLESIRDQREKAAAIGGLYGQLLHDYSGIRPFCSQYARDGISGLKTAASDRTIVLFFFPFGNQVIIANGYCNEKTDREAVLNNAVEIENEHLTEAVNKVSADNQMCNYRNSFE